MGKAIWFYIRSFLNTSIASPSPGEQGGFTMFYFMLFDWFVTGTPICGPNDATHILLEEGFSREFPDTYFV
jgi:hypothetical protein